MKKGNKIIANPVWICDPGKLSQVFFVSIVKTDSALTPVTELTQRMNLGSLKHVKINKFKQTLARVGKQNDFSPQIMIPSLLFWHDTRKT